MWLEKKARLFPRYECCCFTLKIHIEVRITICCRNIFAKTVFSAKSVRPSNSP
jgi:hypothetical protein